MCQNLEADASKFVHGAGVGIAVTEEKVYLRLDGEIAKRFSQVKRYLGLKNDTEVLRSLINWYWWEHQEELRPKLEYYNVNDRGVMVLDRDLNQIIMVYFNPDKILCDYCGVSACKHAEFALSIPRVQEILREKGWLAASESRLKEKKKKEAKIEA